MTTNPMADGRLPDTVRRRERLLTAISTATAGSGEISVSGIARAAGVHRTFLYRHLSTCSRSCTPHNHPGATTRGRR